MWMCSMMGIQLNHKFLNPLKFKKELQKENKLFTFQEIHVKLWHKHLGSNWKAEAQMPVLRDENHQGNTTVSTGRCICSSISLGLSSLCHPPSPLPPPQSLRAALALGGDTCSGGFLCQRCCQKIN